MIRIGVVNIDTSHPQAFAKLLNGDHRARYVAIYNDGFRQDDEVESFMKTNNLEKRYASIEELAEAVDIGFIQGCNWDLHLRHAQPFFDRGKPVFLDKPMVGSKQDVDKLLALHAKGHVILGSSSMRYAKEISDLMALPSEERGELISGWGSCGVDEFNYGIHIVEALCEIFGRPVSCRFVGSAQTDKPCETYYLSFASGASASYSILHGTWLNCDISVITDKKVHSFRIDSSQIYKQLLERICDYMETGKSTLVPADQLVWPIEAMLAGKVSREQQGKTIPLDAIPNDAHFDGGKFAATYGAAASKIYI